jgi:hypothetical protein
MEIMKNEQMQNEINKLWEKINKLNPEENILTDTDYKKNINTSLNDDKLKYKYQKPKTDIIEESKILIDKVKGQTDAVLSDVNRF